jgi:hypothetical protein
MDSNEFILPSKDSTELINTVVYNNYGQLHNSRSISLSKSNNLALATDKCILVLNYNFDWPSSLNHASAVKYFQINAKSSSTTAAAKQASTNTSLVYVDSWIQDLHESKNESLSVSVLRSVPKSPLHADLHKQFFKLDELNASKKRKSFGQQIREAVNNRTAVASPKKRLKPTNSDNQENVETLESLIDPNDEQLYIRKLLHGQTLFFDPYLYEYLAYLNPASYHNMQQASQPSNEQQPSQQKTNFDGYKVCAWNSNLKLNLLFAITDCNQMILFDMTRVLKSNNCAHINLKSLNEESTEKRDFIPSWMNSAPENVTDLQKGW